MPAHMTLKKPAKGSAIKARRARKRAADAILARNVASCGNGTATAAGCATRRIAWRCITSSTGAGVATTPRGIWCASVPDVTGECMRDVWCWSGMQTRGCSARRPSPLYLTRST